MFIVKDILMNRIKPEMVGWNTYNVDRFADDFFEERTLDPESGEFGECSKNR